MIKGLSLGILICAVVALIATVLIKFPVVPLMLMAGVFVYCCGLIGKEEGWI